MSNIFSELLKQEEHQKAQLKQSRPIYPAEPDKTPPSPIEATHPAQNPDPAEGDIRTSLTDQPEVFAPSSTEPQTTSEMQVSLQTSNVASKQASLLAQVRTMGQLKATNAATFRFPPELLELLEEVEYKLRKTHKIKATKNALVVAALAFLLLEYEEKDTESSLYQYLTAE